ncbi:hypothetical protein KOW79_008814 [Hemibagrus wyckioides]|uniref:Uncharacterized protein n=1 Tax=Hemibagrus wyckioides TaxID=337641 RepID=A0A9D3NTW9_9TELE|nr:hypothetical protein KOW79_008814 [Hemibagrus wyckioides]
MQTRAEELVTDLKDPAGPAKRLCRGNGGRALLQLSWSCSPESHHNSRPVTSRYRDPPACAVMFTDICQHVEHGSALGHVSHGYRCQRADRRPSEKRRGQGEGQNNSTHLHKHSTQLV